MKEFQVGDKVYYPGFSTQVLEIESNGNSNASSYPLRISTHYSFENFTKEGYIHTRITSTSIVLATQENRELLEKLHGVEFETPPFKTRSVTLEVPETFVPKLNEVYWCINLAAEDGVNCMTNTGTRVDQMFIKWGVWRTKEEAMLVANAIFNTEKDS